MPATVTLSTTTLTSPVSASAGLIKVDSTSGILPGLRLWIDKELMTVTALDIDPWVRVRRGVDGTSSQAHMTLTSVTIGRADQFYDQDPVGVPANPIPVSPYINVKNGTVWFAQGDDLPDGSAAQRWWQVQTTTYDTGALGLRTVTTSPTASS